MLKKYDEFFIIELWCVLLSCKISLKTPPMHGEIKKNKLYQGVI